MHKALFDDNPDEKLLDRNAPYFHRHVGQISQEYSYLQICKLHDPATSRATNSSNLSISYIVKLDWGDERESIEGLAEKLNKLNRHINPARNKVIAHNDLEVLLRGEPIGAFPHGLDVEYFQYLQEFVNRVHEKWVGGIRPFDKSANNHVEEYLYYLKKLDRGNGSLSPPTSRSHRD